MRRIFIIPICLLFSVSGQGQVVPVEVTDETVKIAGLEEKELAFGFAAGDQIIFNFREIDKNELKEIEITEYPQATKYSDYKTKLVENKRLTVTRDGVYLFRFNNSSLGKRICKIHIQRIPGTEETRNFNTTVVWETRRDTTYHTYTKDVLVGYDTIYTPVVKRDLVKTGRSEEMIMNRSERVHSRMNLENNSFKTVMVTLPNNEITPLITKKIIGWAYWIGVGEESSRAWAKNVNAVKSMTSGLADMTGMGPLGAFTNGAIDLFTPTVGEDVAYWFIPNKYNAELFLANQAFSALDQGKGVAAYGKFSNPLQGTFYIGLLNDNDITPIDAEVKISVFWETNHYEDKQYSQMNLTPRYEKKTFSDPVVKTYTVPVLGKS